MVVIDVYVRLVVYIYVHLLKPIVPGSASAAGTEGRRAAEKKEKRREG
jgi:hypothetical protein